MERIKTGIIGFDKLLEGGIPKGYCVLLSGSPGTGKTIFGLQFLLNGWLSYKEPGLFITFEETASNLHAQAAQFGRDLKMLSKKKEVVIRSMPEEERLNENIIFRMIDEAIKEYNVKRIVIDSLDTYANNIISYEEDIPLSDHSWQKRVIYRFIKRLQRYPQLTKILIAETDEGTAQLSKDGVSEFLADGVIKIEYMTMGGEYSRQLKVRKMRSTKNNPDLFPLEISTKGIIVHS